jgi:hypothetical protein
VMGVKGERTGGDDHHHDEPGTGQLAEVAADAGRGVAGGNEIRTPLPTWRKSWLWYLVSIGSSSPKKTKTAAMVRARGVRLSRSHSRRGFETLLSQI